MKYLVVIIAFFLGMALAIPLLPHLHLVGLEEPGDGAWNLGRRHGHWIFYHAPDRAQKAREGDFDNGVLIGKWVYWHPNGERMGETQFDKGVKSGAWKEWYDNRNLKAEGNFVNDKEDGQFVYYFRNGIRQMEGRYSKGRQVGDWRFWNEDGKEVGVLHYPDTRYDPASP